MQDRGSGRKKPGFFLCVARGTHAWHDRASRLSPIRRRTPAWREKRRLRNSLPEDMFAANEERETVQCLLSSGWIMVLCAYLSLSLSVSSCKENGGVISCIRQNRRPRKHFCLPIHSASAIGVIAASLLLGELFLDEEPPLELLLLDRIAVRRLSFSSARNRITSRW